jgi:Ni/Co efflux regulator RcnB
MKKIKLISIIMAAALCLAQGAAWAQPNRGNGNGQGNGNGRDCPPNCERGRDPGRQDPRGNNNRFDNGRDNRRPDMGRNEGERGAGPNHSFYRGERLPPDYRGRQYVVEDWRGHGLRTPPRGYHWVQTGGDYVLVAIATGVILELLLNR